jgi:hypothetical protein
MWLYRPGRYSSVRLPCGEPSRSHEVVCLRSVVAIDPSDWQEGVIHQIGRKEFTQVFAASLDSGAKCNRAKQTGFARLCQAL